jgi:hypothetical protein
VGDVVTAMLRLVERGRDDEEDDEDVEVRKLAMRRLARGCCAPVIPYESKPHECACPWRRWGVTLAG